MARVIDAPILGAIKHGRVAPIPKGSPSTRRPPKKRNTTMSAERASLPEIRHGQHIYVYNNLRTKQVVYSLTQNLNNNHALKQLPFLGKKTVPERIRKDMWTPLCIAEFPSPHQGLLAYRKLREFRRLHETSYPIELIQDKKNKGNLVSKKMRGRILMDQKANSVADLAAVLLQQEEGPSEERIAEAERRIARVEKLKKTGKKNFWKAPLDVGKEFKGVDGVKVRWANMLDADFARKWPLGVVHDELRKHRHTALAPGMEWKPRLPVEEEEEEKVVDEVVQAKAQDDVKASGKGDKGSQAWWQRLLPGKVGSRLSK